ncbi:carbon dioxide concentrating mechanism protein CcmK [Gloeomargarita lithophora Alchichica-D10]|jgi:carbon dioxide concentrating mechanism protein CcmK|uniref:Carboxysome shell protein CcmK n=1 Tax=Gloeomargarita lithophora Alchichica-D10 TaxID=1188229 RepID=A0A1J0AFX2_9CYAN|nr:carbon dioxide-concentrating mechanism protein CcmK [Gloeomargarita lithophora]APB34833.1 carbon dioxide concentrating mechanism protein CcmK [Gloeomargarita lithophora Alchichica-D10]
MSVALGMVEVLGTPPTLAVADVMVKAGRVTLVYCERVSGAYMTVIVRGDVSEVKMAVAAGVEAAKKVLPYNQPKEKTLLLSYHIIPRPHPNLERVLPIAYRSAVERFRV